MAESKPSPLSRFEQGQYPYSDKIKKNDDEKQKTLLQVELLKVQKWVEETGAKVVLLFEGREHDPFKQWKLSSIDRASLNKWDDYTEAKEAMFFYTDTADAPWTIIKSNDKKRARLNTMRHVLSQIPYPDRDLENAPRPDPKIVGSASHVTGSDEHILGKSLHPNARKG